MGGNNEFFENFERNKYLKKLPSMQRVKNANLSLFEWPLYTGLAVFQFSVQCDKNLFTSYNIPVYSPRY